MDSDNAVPHFRSFFLEINSVYNDQICLTEYKNSSF